MTLTATRSKTTPPPPPTMSLMRNGMVVLALKPGDPVPTDREMFTVTVTPQLAADWLARYGHAPHGVREATVEKYVAEQKAGRWYDDMGRLEFILMPDGTTRLSDGHHRCTMLTRTGHTWTGPVQFGQDPEALAVEGERRARSIADTLTFLDVPKQDAYKVAASLKLVHLWNHTVGTNDRWLRGGSVRFMDHLDAEALYKATASLWSNVSAWHAVARRLPGHPAAVVSVMALIEQKYPGGSAKAFVDLVATGAGPLGQGKTAYVLLTDAMKGGSANSGTQLEKQRWIMTLLVRAYEAYRTGAATFTKPNAKGFTATPIA